jgi:hypothetical protein
VRLDLAVGEHVKRRATQMTDANVVVACKRLLRFRVPERTVEYNRWGFPVKRPPLEKLLGRFASLAAAFARALEAAGGDEELKRRAARFEELTAPGTTFDKARLTAYKDVVRAVERFKPPAGSLPGAAKPRGKIRLTGRSPRASGWESIAGEFHRVKLLVGDPDHVVAHLPDALAYADRLVGLAASGPEGENLRRWRDELFSLSRQEEAGHLLGCRLILRCRDARSADRGNHDSYRELIALLSGDPPRLVEAVRDAAGALVSATREAPQQAPAGKRSRGRRQPAKNAATEQRRTPDTVVLAIDRWTDLAVGVYEKGFFGLSPRPDAGDVFAITKAHKLPLKGKRWPRVLKLFAESEYGTTARKDSLLFELDYLRFGKKRMTEALDGDEEGPPQYDDEGPPRTHFTQARYDDPLREFRPHLTRLTNTMADLGRELRKVISCPQPGPVFEAEHSEYRATFTTGHLIKDRRGRLRFRRIPDRYK